MFFNLILSALVAISQCDAFAISHPNIRHRPIHRQILGRRGISCEISPSESSHSILEYTDDMWELGLLQDAKNTREYTSRCLCQVICLSEADAYEVTGQAERYGVALIDEFHSELAEHYVAELTRLGIAVCAATDE